jgi:hypothetical protein
MLQEVIMLNDLKKEIIDNQYDLVQDKDSPQYDWITRINERLRNILSIDLQVCLNHIETVNEIINSLKEYDDAYLNELNMEYLQFKMAFYHLNELKTLQNQVENLAKQLNNLNTIS